MRKRVSRYSPGDPLLARRLNDTVVQANRLDNAAVPMGLQGVSTEAFDGRVGPAPVRFYLVRMKCDWLPAGHEDAPTVNPDDLNASVVAWDDEVSDWAAVPNCEIQVESKDGLPLLEGDIVLVYLMRETGKHVPAHQEKFAWVRIPPATVADVDGYYAAKVDEWDEATQTWVEVRDCYVRDANA